MLIISFEILLIIVLVLANGVFAMSEMAVVSSRKARLQQLANSGDLRAGAALALANAPDNFLSTVQIGITLIGIMAGAFGGATIADQIASAIRGVPLIAPYSDVIGLGAVVLAITSLSLIFGELIPKRLALNNPERVASLVARPMNMLANLARPVVYLLSLSSKLFFRVLGIRPSNEPSVTEEEIKILIEQGTADGVFEESEKDLVKSVFRLGDKRVGALMTPRREIVWFDIGDSGMDIRKRMAASQYSRFPVCEGRVDNVIGVVKAKDFLAAGNLDDSVLLESVLKRPLFIPETTTALQALESFKRAHTHIAFVIDEHGAVEGLITTNDILEAIVGDMSLPAGETYVTRRDDGSWLIDGSLPIDDFKEFFSIQNLSGEEKGSYQTLAGFVLIKLGRIPSTADNFEAHGLRFEISDMDGNRIDKVLVTRIG